MKIVVDACSIILLAKAAVLEELAKWREVMITKGVYEEVMEGKEKQLVDALILEKLVNEGKILLRDSIKKELSEKLKVDFGLGRGEAESIALAMEIGDMIVTDNKQGRKAARVQGLKLAGSIEAIISLYKTKRITREKAQSGLKKLKEEGWFQDYLIEEAMKEVQNG